MVVSEDVGERTQHLIRRTPSPPLVNSTNAFGIAEPRRPSARRLIRVPVSAPVGWLGQGPFDNLPVRPHEGDPQGMAVTQWRIARPKVWMFPGRDRINPMTTRQFNRICHMAAELAGLPKWVAPHTLRHSFATHPLERSRSASPARATTRLPRPRDLPPH